MSKAKVYGVKARLAEIIQENVRKSARGDKASSAKTQTKRWTELYNAFEDLWAIGYKIEEPKNLSLRHTRALVALWEERDYAASTLQNKISILRVFAGWIGKPKVVPETSLLVSGPDLARRSYATRQDKSWNGKAIDISLVLESVRNDEPAVALQLEMQWAFGLRVRESCMFRPAEDVGVTQSGAKFLHVHRGTKGGRHRIVWVDEDWQTDILARAGSQAGQGSLVPVHCNMGRWLNRYSYVVRKHGICKDGLGATSHGLRHEFAHRQYEKLLGEKVPVRGGGKPFLSKEEILAGKRRLAEQLGHSRPGVVTCYSGSISTGKRDTLKGSGIKNVKASSGATPKSQNGQRR